MTEWGPDNPHPLSRMKTELVWEGKYDEYGNRRPLRLPSSPLPLQRIETIDEPHDREKARQLSLFDEDAFAQKAHHDDWRNMLIWGDNKLVMASLLEQFRGQIDLIYIDPPFDVGADFTMQVQIGEGKEKVQKEQSILEAVVYRDTWGRGTDSYLHMMYERLTLMRELLSERGSIFVHCDWHIGHSIRHILDEVFGKDNFCNEIVWYYYNKLHDSRKRILPRAHNVVFRYAKVEGQQIHSPLKEKRDKPVKKLKYRKVGGQIQNIIGEDGKALTYVSTERTVDDVWRIRCLQPANKTEKLNFDTQKPEDFLGRILTLGSRSESLVADFFCGSGTTLAVAEKLGRRWIGADLGRYAIHTTRKRLIQVQRELHEKGQPYRSFDVYNLGRYERQWWQLERLKGADGEHRRIVLRFYKAAPLGSSPAGGGGQGGGQPPHPLLHGKKGTAYVHVDQIDSIFTYDELQTVAEAVRAVGGRELHCLAWEFEMELSRKKEAIEAETGLTIRLKYIPREIMEPNRTEVQFFEAGALEARPIVEDGRGDVELVRFTPALAEAPENELAALRERAVESPFDFIDFWAVDFDYSPDKPFEHHWQDFRTRKKRSLKTRSDLGWKYETSGRHQIAVKVIDVFGVDTTIVLDVEV